MTRTKVLHIATRFVHGGSERDLSDAISSLSSDEYESCLMVGGVHHPELLREMLPPDCRVVVEPHLLRQVHPFHDLQAFMALRTFIRNNRFDVVHTCQSKAGVLGRLAARAAGTPVILHNLSMANFFERRRRHLSTGYRVAERLVGRWTDAYCVVGRDLRQRYVGAHIGRPDRYHLIRSAVDLKRFHEASELDRGVARAKYHSDPDAAVVCYVGSLEERKGVKQLPDFLDRLRSLRAHPVHLLIAGEGELELELRAGFTARGLSGHVTFLGFTIDAPGVIAASDCLVLLSEAEGLPQVLVQAAAVRRPFVAYAVDGVNELVSLGATGSVATNPTEAARHALRYLEQPTEVPAVDLSEWSAENVRLRYRYLFDSLTRRLKADRRTTREEDEPRRKRIRGLEGT